MLEASAIQHLGFRRAYTRPIHNLEGLDIRFWARAMDPAADLLVSHHVASPDQLCHGMQFPT
eukprot:1028699-Alexandrium_andersonii.AAC.1